MGAYTGTLKDPQDHQGSAYKEPKSSSPGRLHSKVKSLEVKGSLLESEERLPLESMPELWGVEPVVKEFRMMAMVMIMKHNFASICTGCIEV